MQTLDPSFVNALATIGAAVLMVYAGVGKRLLSWRPTPVRTRRPKKQRRPGRSWRPGGRR